MKKVLLGSMLFLASAISIAVILAGSMASEWTVNGEFSSIWNIARYGLMPAVYIFGGISIFGMALAIWGIFEKK